MKKILPRFLLVVSILFVFLLWSVSAFAANTTNQQSKCVVFLPSLSNSVNSGLLRLQNITSQTTSIYNAIVAFYEPQKKQTLQKDYFILEKTAISSYGQKALDHITITRQQLANIDCSSKDLGKKIDLAKASFAQDLKNFEAYKLSVKGLISEIQLSMHAQTASAGALVTPTK